MVSVSKPRADRVSRTLFSLNSVIKKLSPDFKEKPIVDQDGVSLPLIYNYKKRARAKIEDVKKYLKYSKELQSFQKLETLFELSKKSIKLDECLPQIIC